MEMKHFVLGFVFNKSQDAVLLVEKKRPDWQKGFYNGIGGKIKLDETPLEAMNREAIEEVANIYKFEHVITFVCPGGTVFVFKAVTLTDIIPYQQMEDEILHRMPLTCLPEKMMANLKWMIPVCLSNLQFPIILQQNTLGVL